MFSKYIKTAFFNLKKSPLDTVISVVGLTIGIWALTVTGSIGVDEYSYDRQWKNAKDIYRIISVSSAESEFNNRLPTSFVGLPKELKENFSEVVSFTSFTPRSIRLHIDNYDKEGIKINTILTDTAVWQLLDLKILSGNPEVFVEGYKNLVITKSFRDKYLQNGTVLNKIVYDSPSSEVNGTPYYITGVIEDIPSNSHLRAEAIVIDKRSSEELSPLEYGSFTNNYILMRPGTEMKKFTSNVNMWYRSFVNMDKPFKYEFQPMADIYLKSDFAQFQNIKGNERNIYFFVGCGILLFVISCINYTNLCSSRILSRMREVGVRRIHGASKLQIFLFFAVDSFMVFMISTILASVIYYLSLNWIESYLGHSLEYKLLSSVYIATGLLTVVLVLSLLTATYPVLLLGRLSPVDFLRGRLSRSTLSNQNLLRKVFIVIQFIISISVLAGTVIVRKQLDFIDEKDLGFDKKNLLAINYVSWEGKLKPFKEALKQVAGVKNVSATTWIPANGGGYMSKEVDNPLSGDKHLTVWYILADDEFSKTLDLKLIKGRFLSSAFGRDIINDDSLLRYNQKAYNKLNESRASLITVTTARIFGVDKLNAIVPGLSTAPVGVLKDFHNLSLFENKGPTVIYANNSMENSGMLIRITPGSERNVLKSLKRIWSNMFPEKWLETEWIDDKLSKQYEADRKLKYLFNVFSALTMMLAASGVFALIVHVTQQRTREIGIRKVCGATTFTIMRLISLEFIMLVIVGGLISIPISWLTMKNWLENFSYKISISVWFFAIAVLITAFITIITISFRVWRAASVSPSLSLRNE